MVQNIKIKKGGKKLACKSYGRRRIVVYDQEIVVN
jgi:hypothetical protein